MNVVIVGAGIAGLTAAISLRRAGHRVTLYERSGHNNEVGAALTVPPNAGRYLRRWGLDPEKARFIECLGMDFRSATTLDRHFIHDHHSTAEKYGEPIWMAHRVDLHEALKALATDTEGPGTPAVIHLRSEVVHFVSSPVFRNSSTSAHILPG